MGLVESELEFDVQSTEVVPVDPVMNNNKQLSTRLGPKAVSAPVAKGTVRMSRLPKFLSRGNSGDIRVSHREYISDINGSVAFAVNSLAVNPGLAAVFPWLSGVARRFESYRFSKLVYHFEPVAATTATGSVMGAIDYDASDAAPESKTQVMAYRHSVRSPPWSDFSMVSLQEDIQKRKSYYVRSGALSANQDIKLYDVGNFFLCTQGQAGATAVGELYVEYVVDLMTPQLGPPSAGDAIYGAFTGTSNSAPFSTSSGNLPATVGSTGTTTSVNTWTFTGAWQGYVTVNLVGTGLASIVPSGTATSAELNEVFNGTSTQDMALYTLTAQAGQTFILTISNTTITSSGSYFGQADV